MEKLNELMVEETLNEVAEEVVDQTANYGIAKKAVGVALIVGGVLVVRTLYKKVIKPKLAERKAKKCNCEDGVCNFEEYEASDSTECK